LPAALQGLTFTSASHLLHRRLGLVRVAVEQGQSCWKQLELQRFVNAREVALLESAEAVGNLPWTLNAIADSIERRWSFRSHALLEVFGPVVSVVLGCGVLFLFIAFFLPMVNLLVKLSEMQ
jgi:type II secretory pathway component PulF